LLRLVLEPVGASIQPATPTAVLNTQATRPWHWHKKEQQSNERKALHDESMGTSITAATGMGSL